MSKGLCQLLPQKCGPGGRRQGRFERMQPSSKGRTTRMVWGTASRQSRGYGKEWDKIRPRIMARDCGLCQPCKRKGRVTVGTQVDHIVSKANAKRMGWTPAQIDADRNLQCICEPCHKDKTERERGFTPKPEIGQDGWPVE